MLIHFSCVHTLFFSLLPRSQLGGYTFIDVNSHPRCQEIDKHLIQLVWSSRPAGLLSSPSPSVFTGGTSHLTLPYDSSANVPLNPGTAESSTSAEKRVSRTGRQDVTEEDTNEKRANVKKSFFGWKTEKSGRDIEADKPATRPTRLFAPVYNGLGAGLCLCASIFLK